MKVEKTILAALIIIGSSCSKKDELPSIPNVPADDIIRVATDANSVTRARATTQNLNSFRLYVTNASSPDYSYQNVQAEWRIPELHGWYSYHSFSYALAKPHCTYAIGGSHTSTGQPHNTYESRCIS